MHTWLHIWQHNYFPFFSKGFFQIIFIPSTYFFYLLRWLVSAKLLCWFYFQYLKQHLLSGKNVITGKLVVRRVITGELILRKVITDKLSFNRVTTGRLPVRRVITGNLPVRRVIIGKFEIRRAISGKLALRGVATGKLPHVCFSKFFFLFSLLLGTFRMRSWRKTPETF